MGNRATWIRYRLQVGSSTIHSDVSLFYVLFNVRYFGALIWIGGIHVSDRREILQIVVVTVMIRTLKVEDHRDRRGPPHRVSG